jgi:hypothetical protein
MCELSESVLSEDPEACLMLDMQGDHVPGLLDLLKPMKKGTVRTAFE